MSCSIVPILEIYRDGELTSAVEAEHKANGNIVKISNAEQNRIYEEEKRRVWDLQAAALSSSIPPQLDAADQDHNTSTGATPAGMGPRFARGNSRRAFSRSNSMAATPFYGESSTPRDFSPAPSADETSFTGNHVPKVMRITRILKGGGKKVEIIRDPQVIATYRRRVENRKIEEFRHQADSLRPTENSEDNDLMRAASVFPALSNYLVFQHPADSSG